MSPSTPPSTPLPRNRILIGDATERLRSLPDGQVDSIVTSPPYFRLRDYDAERQIGLETHVDEWVQALAPVMQEAARVLTPTGTLWLNLGDTYSTTTKQGASNRKSLLLAPERVALMLLADGWLLRNKVVWAKTNHAPSSASDRLTCSWEVIYLLVRSPRYFFDLDAIRIPHRSGATKPTTRPPTRSKQGSRPPRDAPSRASWRGPNTDRTASGLEALKRAGLPGHPLGKNPGDVLRMSVSNYRGAHFATFPQHLAEHLIRAGTPERRCTLCRLPWRRPVRRLGAVATRLALAPTCACSDTPAAALFSSEPGLVLDPFMGAGTTAIAAEVLDRDWLGIELNPAFARQATERITTARGQPRGSP